MKAIALDVLIIWASVCVGAFALVAWIPVLLLCGVIGVVTGAVWLGMDMVYAIKDARRDRHE